jgi:hypothetical protein
MGACQMNKIELVDTAIVELDTLEVRGVQNMRIVFSIIEKLAALKTMILQEGGEIDGNHVADGQGKNVSGN